MQKKLIDENPVHRSSNKVEEPAISTFKCQKQFWSEANSVLKIRYQEMLSIILARSCSYSKSYRVSKVDFQFITEFVPKACENYRTIKSLSF